MKKNNLVQALIDHALARCLFAALILAASAGAAAQGRLNISEVKDGLHVIMGPGGNIGVRLTSEGVILIDNKFPQDFVWKPLSHLVQFLAILPMLLILKEWRSDFRCLLKPFHQK